MIITQTPLRVSFFGGGTDLADYYKINGGAVLSTAINKYIYIILKERYDDLIVLNYSKREIVKNIQDIQHPLIRIALDMTGINRSIEITSIGDIPSEGSGLGSSSSFSVGLLNALYAFKGEFKDPHFLAEKACEIEIGRLKEPIGKQDQYAAAYGGIRHYTFNTDGKVDVERVNVKQKDIIKYQENMYMFYTGITRKSSSVLSDQKANISKKMQHLDILRKYADDEVSSFESGDISEIGIALDKNWQHKKQLTSKIENDVIDDMYVKGKQAGAIGGKLLGAGGGGFFLFVCPPEKVHDLRCALKDYKELPFRFDPIGSRIILNTPVAYSFIDNL